MSKLPLPLLIISILVSFYITGCTSNSADLYKPPKGDIDKNKLTVESKLLAENEKEYKVEISVKNQTGYAFLPTGVFLQPYIEKHEDNTVKVTQSNLPILIEANTVSADNYECLFEAIIPKIIFNLEPDINHTSIKVDVRGLFINKSGQIISQVGDVSDIKLTQ